MTTEPPEDFAPFATFFADNADDLLDQITEHIAEYRKTAPTATMDEAVAYVQSLDPVLDAFLSWTVRGDDWLTDPLAVRLCSLFSGFEAPTKLPFKFH
jgi:hypothetical protein